MPRCRADASLTSKRPPPRARARSSELSIRGGGGGSAAVHRLAAADSGGGGDGATAGAAKCDGGGGGEHDGDDDDSGGGGGGDDESTKNEEKVGLDELWAALAHGAERMLDPTACDAPAPTAVRDRSRVRRVARKDLAPVIHRVSDARRVRISRP